jgi:hypothetical protein
MLDSIDSLEAVASGRISLAQAATALGCSEAEVARQVELLKLASALAQRQWAALRRKAWRSVAGVAAVLTLTSSVWLTRNAWAAGCTQTLPAPLVTFCPDDPALASQINGNFQQLATWLQTKTGTLTDGTLSNANITATGTLTSVGSVRGAASNGTSGFRIGWNQSGGTGETDFFNYRGLGPGGFHFYNSGDSSSPGSLIMSLDANGRATISDLVATTETAYELSCGEASFSGGLQGNPFCCRINVRDGAVSCAVATSSNGTSWGGASGYPTLGSTTLGRYHVSCVAGAPGANFPFCCRINANTGSTICGQGNNYSLGSSGNATVF